MNEEQETYQVEQCRECHYFEACGGAKKGNGPMPDSTCIVAKVVQSDGVEALEKLKEELLWEINSNRILGKEIDNFDMKIGWNAEAPYVLPNGEEVDFMCAGDLLGQSMATSYGAGSFGIPLFGLFGACSTCGEALLLSAMLLAGGYGTTAVSVTSSHYASAEKEFRYPLEYGNQKPLSSGWTVTGSGAFLLSSEMTKQGGITIAGGTLGRVVDFGCKDAMNMGACMAPAAADVLERHFKDFGRSPKDYDRIFTGDLGNVGSTILKEMMAEKGFSLDGKHDDCGSMIYEQKEQDTNNGGSGPGCAAVVLAAEILPRMVRGEWKRVLFIPTGALLSKTGYNEGQTIPAIAHAVLLEA